MDGRDMTEIPILKWSNNLA